MRKILFTSAGVLFVILGYVLLTVGPEASAREFVFRGVIGVGAVFLGDILLLFGLLSKPMGQMISLFFPEEAPAGAGDAARARSGAPDADAVPVVVKRVKAPPLQAPPRRTTLLAVVEPPSGGAHGTARYALMSGKQIVQAGSCAPNALLQIPAATTRVAFLSQMSYLERLTLTAPKRGLLEMAARRHVNEEQIFTGPYRLRLRVAATSGQQFVTELVAALQSDLDAVLEEVRPAARPVTLLLPAECAIAALLAKATPHPAVAHWARGDLFLSLLIADNAVVARRVERRASATWSDYNALIESNTRLFEAEARQKLGREVQASVYFGELYDMMQRSAAAPAEGGIGARPAVEGRRMAPTVAREPSPDAFLGDIEARIAKLFVNADGTDATAEVFHQPELYGLAFARQDFSLLESGYQHEVLAHRYARPAAAAAAAAGVVLLYWGGTSLLRALAMHEEFVTRQTKLVRLTQELEPRIPTPNAVEALLSTLRLSQQQQNEMRVDRFLAWLSQVTPPGVILDSVNIVPSGPGRYSVNLNATIAGSYSETRDISFTFLKNLSPKVSLEANQFAYQPGSDKASGSATFASRVTALAAQF